MIDFKKEFPFIGSFNIKTEGLIREKVFPVKTYINSVESDFKKDIIARKNDNVIFDFENEYVGGTSFVFYGFGRVKIIFGESYEETYSESKFNSNDWYKIPTDEFSVDNKTVCTTKRRAFRYIRLIVVEGEIFINKVELSFEHRDLKPVGCPNTIDKDLSEIYNICERTIMLCNQKFMEDGIKRDGILWVSDARIISLCNYSMFNYSTIVKEALEYIAESQSKDGKIYANAIISGAHIVPQKIDYMFDYVCNKDVESIPNFIEGCGLLHYVQYSLDFVNIAYEYYIQTNDKEFINKLYPYLKRTFDYLFTLSEIEETAKLLPAPEQALKLRNSVDQGGYLSTYYASMVYALKNFIKINDIFSYDNEVYNNKINLYTDKCLQFFNGEIFIDKDKCGRKGVPLSALSMAYLSGILDKEQFKRSYMKYKKDFSYIVDGYWKYFTILSMFESGMKREAVDSIKEFWGCMLKYGATTCWEQYDRENLYILKDFVISRCHGWSAGAGDLIKKFLCV